MNVHFVTSFVSFSQTPLLGLMTEVKFPEFMDEETEAKSFIEQLLAKDPNQRPRFDGIKNHAWMSDLELDAEKLKAMKLPFDWVQKHVFSEAKARPRSMRRNSVASHHRTNLSLSMFIEDICNQMLESGRNKEDAEKAVARWLTEPTAKTLELFRHWNWLSGEAIRMEIAAANSSQSRRKMRRATQ